MNEMTEAGPKGKGKRGKKAGNDGEVSVEGQVARMLVRAIWAQDWTSANPEGKPEDRKTAWKAARTDVLETNLKSYRRAVASLSRLGVVMSITPAAADADTEGEDAGDDA